MIPCRSVSGSLPVCSFDWVCAATLALAAAGGFAATAHGQTEFNPANQLSVVDVGGFTGTFNPPTSYTRAQVVFQFFGLPNPFVDTFSITGISLTGEGITSSLSFGDVSIDGLGEEGFYFTSLGTLNSSVSSLNFADSRVSFTLPGGKLEEGDSFNVEVLYRNISGTQVNTSSEVLFVAVPEPATLPMALTAVAACAGMRMCRRERPARG